MRHYNITFIPVCFSVQVSANGTTLRNEILGTVQLRTMLTGMPELRLGLNDKILFESTGRTYWLEKL